MNPLAAYIQAQMQKMGLTHAMLARKMRGAGRRDAATLKKIARGEMPDVPVEVLQSLAPVLGVRVEDLHARSLQASDAAGLAAVVSTRIVGHAEMDAGEEEKGWAWNVVLMTAGYSKNGWYWDPEVLEASVALFEGCPLYVHRAGPHVDLWQRSERDKCGWFDTIRYESDPDQLVGVMHITKNAAWLRDMLMSAFSQGKTDITELSTHVLESGVFKMIDDRMWRVPDKIMRVFSTDAVGEGAAGGRILEMAASASSTMGGLQMRERLLKMLKERRPDLYARLDLDAITDEALAELVETSLVEAAEAVRQAQSAGRQDEDESEDPEDEEEDESSVSESHQSATRAATEAQRAADSAQTTLNKLMLREARVALREALSSSNLPEPYQEEIRIQMNARFDAGEIVGETEIQETVKRFRDMYAAMAQQAPLSMPRVEMGQEVRDRYVNAMMGLLCGRDEEGVRPFANLRHAYIEMTGQAMPSAEEILIEASFSTPWVVTLNPRMGARVQQSMNSLKASDLGQVLADAMHKLMIRNFQASDQIRKVNLVVSDITTATDFKTMHRTRMGGYGLLPTVPERGTYDQLSSPTDEEETGAVAKKGGKESITLEAIANDDIQALRAIPRELTRAAVETLYHDVFDIFTTNPTMGDSIALFHSSHGNLGSSTLSKTSASAVRQAMMSQSRYATSTQILEEANAPARLLRPIELEDTAFQLIRNPKQPETTDNDLNPRVGQFEDVQVGYWTDANDHYWMADPMKGPTIEASYYQGRREPEVFVSNNPATGAPFDSDEIEYKIRFIYKVFPLEWRSMYAQQPA